MVRVSRQSYYTGRSEVLHHGRRKRRSEPMLGYRVYVRERRGHAHTPDRPGPLMYQLMADNTVAYRHDAVGTAAHLVGWSDGAVVALYRWTLGRLSVR
jgi:alpha-beta hydrolase superfamily lysophospholipase